MAPLANAIKIVGRLSLRLDLRLSGFAVTMAWAARSTVESYYLLP